MENTGNNILPKRIHLKIEIRYPIVFKCNMKERKPFSLKPIDPTIVKKYEAMVCSKTSFMLHTYQHFNPNKYRLDVKIAVVKSGFHYKYNLNYHIIWIPKYRKVVLTGTVKEELQKILEEESKTLQLEMLALEIMPDHLHLFVGAKPTHIPCVIVKQLKGVSSMKLRERFPDLTYLGYPAAMEKV